MAKKGKTNKRKGKEAIERPIRYKKYLQFFLIVCEDESTEPYYFQKFKELFPEHTMFLKTVGTGKAPLGVVEQSIIERDILLQKSNKEIDFVWAIFDKDDADENETTITNFERAFEIATAENINIAFSNEVFELWLLLHLKYISPDQPIPRAEIYENLENSIREFNENFADFVYQHGKKEVVDVIYQIGDEKLAMERAWNLQAFHKKSLPIESNPSTKIHILVKELRDWIAYYNWKPEE